MALQPQRRHVLCAPGGGHRSEPQARAARTPPAAGQQLPCSVPDSSRLVGRAPGTGQSREAAPKSRHERTRFGVHRKCWGTLCHSFSSRGSSRLSCSVPSLRELLLSGRASFLPSRPYLARMTSRQGLAVKAGPGLLARSVPLPAGSLCPPSFLVTIRTQQDETSLRATRSPTWTAAQGPAQQQWAPCRLHHE